MIRKFIASVLEILALGSLFTVIGRLIGIAVGWPTASAAIVATIIALSAMVGLIVTK